MKKRTLTKETVLAAAVELTEERGLPELTMPALAAKLGIKSASLYNHISGIDEVKLHLARYAIAELGSAARDDVIGHSKGDALLRFAFSWRKFALEHPELNRALNTYENQRELVNFQDNGSVAIIAHKILDSYHLTREQHRMFARMFRSALYGFITLETAGVFKNAEGVEESFEYMVNHIISALDEMKEQNGRQ